MNQDRKNNLVGALLIATIVGALIFLGLGCSTVKKVFGSETPAVASVMLKDGNNLL